MPELWNKSKFHVNKGRLSFFSILGAGIATFQVVLLVVTSSTAEIIGNLVILCISVIYALARNSKVTMEISYEDC